MYAPSADEAPQLEDSSDWIQGAPSRDALSTSPHARLVRGDRKLLGTKDEHSRTPKSVRVARRDERLRSSPAIDRGCRASRGQAWRFRHRAGIFARDSARPARQPRPAAEYEIPLKRPARHGEQALSLFRARASCKRSAIHGPLSQPGRREICYGAPRCLTV